MNRSWVMLGCAFAATILAASCGGTVDAGSGQNTAAAAGQAGSGASAGTGGKGGSGGQGGSAGKGGAGGQGAGGAMAGSGGSPTQTSCTEPIECTLASTDCCHMECSEAQLSDFAAVNQQYVQAYLQTLCTPPPPCPGYVCPESEHQTYVRTAAQFASSCRNNQCVGFDLRTSELSSCTDSTQCRLRYGAQCCESCSASIDLLVAVNKTADLGAVLCGNALIDCCPSPPLPPNAGAVCNSGHCMVVWAK